MISTGSSRARRSTCCKPTLNKFGVERGCAQSGVGGHNPRYRIAGPLPDANLRRREARPDELFFDLCGETGQTATVTQHNRHVGRFGNGARSAAEQLGEKTFG